jgi:hypothetical protein
MFTDTAAGVRPGAPNLRSFGLGFFSTEHARTELYNDIFQTVDACDSDIRERLGALFAELRRVNREADKLLREQERRWFGWV